jgi:hypothetical protein
MSNNTDAVRKAVEVDGTRPKIRPGDLVTWAKDFATAFEDKAKELGIVKETEFRLVDLTDKLKLDVVGLSALQAIITNAAKSGSFEAFKNLFELGVELGWMYGTVAEREKHVATSGSFKTGGEAQ